MNILVFDTAAEKLEVAVSAAAENRFAFRSVSGFRHSETLLPTISSVLDEAKLAMNSIALIACTQGPGSFTGLRIGMATAKGLSMALGIPWVAVPTLDCLARPFGELAGPVVPVMDARKNRLYAAMYFHGRRQGDYLDISFQDLVEKLDSYPDILFTGPDAELFRELAGERPGFVIDEGSTEARMRGLVSLALDKLNTEGPEPDTSGPLYLREPEIG